MIYISRPRKNGLTALALAVMLAFTGAGADAKLVSLETVKKLSGATVRIPVKSVKIGVVAAKHISVMVRDIAIIVKDRSEDGVYQITLDSFWQWRLFVNEVRRTWGLEPKMTGSTIPEPIPDAKPVTPPAVFIVVPLPKRAPVVDESKEVQS